MNKTAEVCLRRVLENISFGVWQTELQCWLFHSLAVAVGKLIFTWLHLLAYKMALKMASIKIVVLIKWDNGCRVSALFSGIQCVMNAVFYYYCYHYYCYYHWQEGIARLQTALGWWPALFPTWVSTCMRFVRRAGTFFLRGSGLAHLIPSPGLPCTRPRFLCEVFAMALSRSRSVPRKGLWAARNTGSTKEVRDSFSSLRQSPCPYARAGKPRAGALCHEQIWITGENMKENEQPKNTP